MKKFFSKIKELVTKAVDKVKDIWSRIKKWFSAHPKTAKVVKCVAAGAYAFVFGCLCIRLGASVVKSDPEYVKAMELRKKFPFVNENTQCVIGLSSELAPLYSVHSDHTGMDALLLEDNTAMVCDAMNDFTDAGLGLCIDNLGDYGNRLKAYGFEGDAQVDGILLNMGPSDDNYDGFIKEAKSNPLFEI